MSIATKTAVTVKQVVPLFAVTDIEQSVRYYMDGLGFTMKHKWIVEEKLRWCWLELGGAAIMLQQFRTEGHDSWKPTGKVGEGVALYFNCDDAVTFYHDVTSRGIKASEPQVGNSMWETFLTDPDGYRINFVSPTDVPEETKLSEVKAER